MLLPGLPSNPSWHSFTVSSAGKSLAVKAKFDLGNSQNYFDPRGGNNGSVPLKSPAAGSTID